jgi:hypothetical protein
MVHAEDAIDLIVGWIRTLLYEVFRAHNDTGRAEAALKPPGSDEAVGEGLAFKLAEPFERQNRLARNAVGWNAARNNGAPVDDDCAAPTLTLRAAAILGRDHPALVTQDFQQRRPVYNIDCARISVEREFNPVLHRFSAMEMGNPSDFEHQPRRHFNTLGSAD